MKFKFFFCVFLILSQTFQGQTITKGLIIPKDANSLDYCCVYIPTSGINIYNKPNGTVLGKIGQDSKRDSTSKSYEIFLNQDGQLEPIDHLNLEEVRYNVMALVYVEQNSNFVKIKNGCWIEVSELNDKGLKIVNWMQYLIDKSPNVIGYYARDPGLDLRKTPSEQSELILILKGDLLEIKLTQETKGLWCKVIVTKYSDHPCTSKGNFDEIKLETFTGWIELLSDDQTPNVSYYKSC
tara:strand:- start:2116 stop:2829 length:714 start_codon:yes stop_codon:yes gene_type:complete